MTTEAPATVQNIDPVQALELIQDGAVRVLDVRTPGEFQANGHIPGAELLPVDLIATAAATLAREGAPVLVACEHGVRSAHAASFLARAGFPRVLNLVGGMSQWSGPREHVPRDPSAGLGPSSWLVENADLLPRSGQVLDLACGRGRHALLLAGAGFPVHAVDADEETIRALQATAARLGMELRAEVLDLEVAGVELPPRAYDAILGFHYLHRPLFPLLVRALRPGGVMLYETFTSDQAERAEGPSNPDFLLQPGELERLVQPLEVLRRREGEFHGRMISAVAARC